LFIETRIPPPIRDGLHKAFLKHAEQPSCILTIQGLHELLSSLEAPQPAYAISLAPTLYRILLTFGYYPFPPSYFGSSPELCENVFIRALALLRTTSISADALLPEITVGDETRVQGLSAARFSRLLFDALARSSHTGEREHNEGADVEGLEDVLDVVSLLQPAFRENPYNITELADESFSRGFLQHITESLPRRVFDPWAEVKAEEVIELVSTLSTFTGADYKESQELWGAILPDMLIEGDYRSWDGLSEMGGLQLGRPDKEGEGWSGLVAAIVEVALDG
jgi:hypothetical protein